MKSAIQTVVRYGYVPFMLIGLNGAAYFVVTSGESPYRYLLLAPLLALAFATAFAAERVLPYFDEWNHSHDDDHANVWHTIVYETSNIIGVLMIPFVGWLFSITPGGLLGWWPREWPILAQLAMAIVIGDFFFMYVHYLSHKYSTLWRLHSVHHGVSRLYSFNGLVRHPLHQGLDMAIATAPMAFAGMPIPVAVLLGFSVSVMLIVQHSNVDAALGPFRNVFSIGRIHHLHHVNWGKEGDVNFGLFFTLWDRVFGTFRPEPPRPIGAHDMGVDEVPSFPKSYREHLSFPFRYKPGSAEPYVARGAAAAQPARQSAPIEERNQRPGTQLLDAAE